MITLSKIHSRKKLLKGLKMTTAKWFINRGELQDLLKRGVCWCGGGDALK
jgi:hypothetical protein